MKTCLDPSGDRQVSTPIQFKGMGTCKGVSSSVCRPRYVSWCMDSPALPEPSTPKVATEKHSDPHAQSAASGSIPLLLLSPPETNGGETFSNHPLQAKLLHSSHQHASPHHSNLSLMKPHSNTDSHSDEGEDKGSEDDNLTNLSPPGAENRSEEDSSLLHPEANRCRLRRSSPVIYRRLRPISWHGGKADTSNQPNSDSSTSASDSLSPDQCGLPTATNMEDLGPKQSWPDHTSSSSPQDEKKQRSISVSSNLNHFLISLFHLPFSGQQGLPEKQKKWHLSACDVPSTPGLSTSTSRKQSELSSCSDIPECSANIFKTTCDLEKENAHFIVVDMVLEVLEGVKWTLGLNQWTSMTDTHQPMDDNVRSHRHKSSAQESCTPEHKHRYDTHGLKQSCSDAKLESHEHRLSDETSHTHLSYVHTSQHTQVKQDDWGNNEAGRQPKTSILSTDSGFEDCGVDSTLTTKDSLRNAEYLAQQLVLQFKRSWLPSREPRRGRLSLRSSLQELPGTGNVAASGGSLTEEIRLRTRMRGSLSWAPPRFQIIFTVQPTLRRSKVVALQHFLCAGCGTEVEPRYIKKLRYCDYLGRYFCDCCHSGSEAVIPGRVLSCWDFGRYPVSDFSKQLLDSVWCQPLFDLSSVGRTLCGRVKELDKFRELQEHLLGIKKLLRTCRLSERVMRELEQLPAHLFSVQPPLFSMDDLLRVKKGHLVTQAKAVLQSAITHVESCELCLARGFICEFCRERDIIFPFQRDICSRCPVCKTCFHKHCFVDKKCPKCVRIQTRKKQPDRSMKRQDS